MQETVKTHIDVLLRWRIQKSGCGRQCISLDRRHLRQMHTTNSHTEKAA